MTTNIKQKVTRSELAKLAGHLSFLKGMVEIEREIDGEQSYLSISKTMEASITECGDIADRLLFIGLETEAA